MSMEEVFMLTKAALFV